MKNEPSTKIDRNSTRKDLESLCHDWRPSTSRPGYEVRRIVIPDGDDDAPADDFTFTDEWRVSDKRVQPIMDLDPLLQDLVEYRNTNQSLGKNPPPLADLDKILRRLFSWRNKMQRTLMDKI